MAVGLGGQELTSTSTRMELQSNKSTSTRVEPWLRSSCSIKRVKPHLHPPLCPKVTVLAPASPLPRSQYPVPRPTPAPQNKGGRRSLSHDRLDSCSSRQGGQQPARGWLRGLWGGKGGGGRGIQFEFDSGSHRGEEFKFNLRSDRVGLSLNSGNSIQGGGCRSWGTGAPFGFESN
jgi:hypothetical protein